MSNEIEKGFNLQEVANLLGMKVRTIRQWVHDGKLKANKIPGTKRWIVLESEIRRLQNGDKN